jgi:uncharacterized protein YacL
MMKHLLPIREPILLARIFFVLIMSLSGYLITPKGSGLSLHYTLGALMIDLLLVLFEYSTEVISSKKILMGALGLFFGLVLSSLIAPMIPDKITGPIPPRLICNMLLGYYGVVLALKHENRLSLSRLKFFISNPRENTCILDTNVIIDGRVRDLYLTHFLKGEIIIPEFILHELQTIADSTDSQKRARGRRGLENLEQLQEIYPNLQIWEKDYEDIRDVDHKLIQLAKELGAELLTNDYNLNKIASLHQICVLNINDLAQALKPSFFVGDEIHIRLIRIGKESHQAVGYLEDGTMVVVDDAKHLIGNEVDIEVTSLLQTSAGRMLFGRVKDNGKNSSQDNDSRKTGNYNKTEYSNRSRS